MYYVYVVQCADGTLYTGYTNNVERRVATHNAGKGGSYTRTHRPVSLLVAWQFPTKGEALRAEYAFKRLTRVQKLQLIASSNVLDGETAHAAHFLLVSPSPVGYTSE
ncbi:MAG: hypothetical protein PVS3B1_30230 [Ktedonobacteraceae bacterium]